MTNPFLSAEIDIGMEDIQAKLDALEFRLKLEKPRSLLQGAYHHHQKDVRRIFKDGQ
jgi:hypothetical protein